MSKVDSIYIWYPDGYPGRAFDLRTLTAVSFDLVTATVRFAHLEQSQIFDKYAFLTALAIASGYAGFITYFEIPTAEAFGVPTLDHKLTIVNGISSAEVVSTDLSIG